MFWRRRTPGWFIDPSKVALGSVVENSSRNLSRSHVKVKYRKESEVRFVPMAKFIRHCQEVIRGGRSLDIEHLLVAPLLKRRYARFFESLTNWDPATRRAYRPGTGQQRPKSRER